jgi:hypothetical protein
MRAHGGLRRVGHPAVGGDRQAVADRAQHDERGPPTALATVTRQTLSERTQEDATLGYAGSYARGQPGSRHIDRPAGGRPGHPPMRGPLPGQRPETCILLTVPQGERQTAAIGTGRRTISLETTDWLRRSRRAIA